MIFSFLVALLLTQACAGKHFLVETKDKTNPDQDYEATLDGQEFRAADHKLESEGHGGSDYRQATEPPPKNTFGSVAALKLPLHQPIQISFSSGSVVPNMRLTKKLFYQGKQTRLLSTKLS